MTPAAERVSWKLEDHELSMIRLQATMARVKARMPAPDFLEAVSAAFQDVQGRAGITNHTTKAWARSCADFVVALQAARAMCTGRPAILVLGCGRGFAGKPAEFVADIAQRAWGEGGAPYLAAIDLTPSSLWNYGDGMAAGTRLSPGHFDIVAGYSLLHFIPDIRQFARLVRFLLKPSGSLVLSHEPNSRFWSNDECRAAVARLRWRKWPQRSKALLSRMTAGRSAAPVPSRTFWDEVNELLKERHGIERPLTENEIRRLADVHRPEVQPGEFRIGCNGFDVETLTNKYLKGFRLISCRTREHLGYNELESLPARWKRREEALAMKCPRDGSVFTAHWKKELAKQEAAL